MARNPVQAKRIIEEEHRSLAAVLHGMLYVIREIRYVRLCSGHVTPAQRGCLIA